MYPPRTRRPVLSTRRACVDRGGRRTLRRNPRVDYVLGVDLGTTFTAAAVRYGDRAVVAQLGSQRAEIPSTVFVKPDGEVLVGDAAERRGAADPTRLAREFKRRVGDLTPIRIGEVGYSAETLMAFLLRGVLETVTGQQEGPPSRVGLTCRPTGAATVAISWRGPSPWRASTASSSIPSRKRPPSSSPPVSGCRSERCSPSTTSAAGRSTPRCCARPRPGSSCWASRTASIGSAESTSTTLCSSTCCAFSAHGHRRRPR